MGYRRRQEPTQEADVLDSEQIECEDKTIVIDMKSNTQGKFLKITETRVGVSNTRGHIILSIETCPALRTLLNEFVAEYERLPPSEDEVSESSTIKTDSFKGYNSRRLYYVDLRENQRGRFLKITLITDEKRFIAIPGESLVDFRDRFAKLLDKFPQVQAPSPSASNLPASKSFQVDRKTFYFDVDKNDRGVFVKVSEVLTQGYRPGHVNVPRSAWEKMAEMFTSLAQEMPYTEESSGSDES